jgi:uncharacterized membrane protein
VELAWKIGTFPWGGRLTFVVYKDAMKTFVSDLSSQVFPLVQRMSGNELRPTLLAFIRAKQPNFKASSCLALSELNVLRQQYIAEFLDKDVAELTDLQTTVLEAMKQDSLLANTLENESTDPLSLGQRLADKVASFGGSWRFIISFGTFLVLWILLNAVVLASRAYDPYPFILLNLILSCIAALQAPVIMMSQNRQEEKDRERSRNDYMINLKSELEIRLLHEKIDHLILHQQRQLIEIQEMQVEMMNEILTRVAHSDKEAGA